MPHGPPSSDPHASGRNFTEVVCRPRVLLIRALFAAGLGLWLLVVFWATIRAPGTEGPLLWRGRVAIGLTLAGFVGLAAYDRFARRRIVTRVQTPVDLAAQLHRYAFPVLLLDSLSAFQRLAVALRWRFRGETIVLTRRLRFAGLAPLDVPFEPRPLRDLAAMFPPADAPRAPLWPRLALGVLLVGVSALLIFSVLGWQSAGQWTALAVTAAVSAQTVRRVRQLFRPIVYAGDLHAGPSLLVRPPGVVLQRSAAFCLAIEVEPDNWQVFVAWADQLLTIHAQHAHFEAFLRVWLSAAPPPAADQLVALGLLARA